MVFTNLSPDDVISECCKALDLSDTHIDLTSDVLLAALLRYSAGIHSPCSGTTLKATVLECLQHLGSDETLLSERIEAVIEGLIIGGDLLELNDVAIDDPDVKATWLFASPPGFVVRPSGDVFLLGIARDQITFLPQTISSRIFYKGFTRMITQRPGEDLPAELHEQGLQQQSGDVWLKSPKIERPDSMLQRLEDELSVKPQSETVRDLRILDPTQPVTHYSRRWTTPQKLTGNFIARRPQEFGAPIWCFVALRKGMVVKLLDLPLRKTRWRGCDSAWHLQMAIDHCRLNPQVYRRRQVGEYVCFDFCSPLPAWAQRRFMILGHEEPRGNFLMSYKIPVKEVQAEERFLQNILWLSRTKDSD